MATSTTRPGTASLEVAEIRPQAGRLAHARRRVRRRRQRACPRGSDRLPDLSLSRNSPCARRWRRLPSARPRTMCREAYKQTNIVNFTTHHEDLRRRPRGAGDHQAQTRDPRHRRRGPSTSARRRSSSNTSDRIDAFEPDPTLGRRVETMLDEREWLLHRAVWRVGHRSGPSSFDPPTLKRRAGLDTPGPP